MEEVPDSEFMTVLSVQWEVNQGELQHHLTPLFFTDMTPAEMASESPTTHTHTHAFGH